MNAYFEMINRDGGIYGRELKITNERDDVSGLQNQEQVQASLAEDNAFATFLADAGLRRCPRPRRGRHADVHLEHPARDGRPRQHLRATPARSASAAPARSSPTWRSSSARPRSGSSPTASPTSRSCARQGNRDSFEKYPTAEVVFFDDTIGFAEPNLSAQVAQMKDGGRRLRHDVHGHQRGHRPRRGDAEAGSRRRAAPAERLRRRPRRRQRRAPRRARS